MKRLLVHVSDKPLCADLLHAAQAGGYQAIEVRNQGELQERVSAGRVDAILLDITNQADLRTIDHTRAHAPDVGIVAIGADPSAQMVIEARRRGAHHFLRKPFDVASFERALAAVTSGLALSPAEDEILTRDPAMRSLLDHTAAAALTEATVQIVGESGTGKGLLTRFLHRRSRRRSGPFVVVSCAGLPESLAESELFGHERGAFTGAVEGRVGQLAAASGGTLVLDEVSDLPTAVAPKLLRVLQERELIPVGAVRPRPVDVRFVATTQHDLAREVAKGRFREDLYYRLDVITLRIPPLRERRGDIPPLARAFLARFARSARSEPPRLTERSLDRLSGLAFRGNVRELENLMRRAAVLFPGAEIDLDRLLSSGDSVTDPLPIGLRSLNLRELERAAVARSLVESGGNRTLASRALGISVRTLRNKIRLYHLS